LEYEQVGDQRRPVLWMGLGQVRDLRAAAIEALLAARACRPFAALDDLLRRVNLQNKEVAHLIRCGALDGLGSSRAALLAEAGGIERGGLGQLGFVFLGEETEPETPAERLAWEDQVLGLPVSVHPLAAVERPMGAMSVGAVLAGARGAEAKGLPVRAAGVRLPGWTGGPGFFLADEQNYLLALPPQGQRAPVAWKPVEVTGRCLTDQWGGVALHVEQWREL
jgi:hypothetical protein